MKRLLFVLVVLFCPVRANADISQYVCHSYFGKNAQTPDDVARVLDLYAPSGKGGVQICTINGGDADKRTSELSPPVSSEIGICEYYERPIFSSPRENGKANWTYSPPEGKEYLATISHYMTIPNVDCPRQDSDAYIITSDISQGTFLAVTKFWQQILADGKIENKKGQPRLSYESSLSLQTLVEALKQRSKDNADFPLQRVFLDGASDASSHIAFEVYKEGVGTWEVMVDFVDGELVVLRVREVEY